MKQLPMFDPIEIPLSKGLVALVDPCDVDLLSFKWFVLFQSRARYPNCAARYSGKDNGYKHIRMHRVILERVIGRDLLDGEMVDHCNGNPLDNRRCNLRLADARRNAQNRAVRTGCKSGYKGVHQIKRWWIGNIKVNGEQLYLGCFDTPEEAALAYNKAAIQFFGEFARLNVVKTDAPAAEPDRR